MDARRYLKNDKARTEDVKPSRHKAPAVGLKERMLPWWRRLLLTIKVLAAGAILGGMVMLLPRLWSWLDRPIMRVEVSGDFRHLERQQVESLLKPFLPSGFFRLDLEELQLALQQNVWVSQAQVRKVWPDKLVVSVVEEVPVARWQSAALISEDGRVLSYADGKKFEQLPALSGPDGREQDVMQQYLALSQQLRILGLKVTGVSLSAAGEWSFQAGDVTVFLGSDALIERIQRLSRLYQDHLQKKWATVKRVDLRYRDGIAVTWKSADAVGKG